MKTMRILRAITLVMSAQLLVHVALGQQAKSATLNDWPAGSTPVEIGRRVAERFLQSSFQPTFSQQHGRSQINHTEVFVWHGALKFAKLSGNQELTSKLIRRFDPLFTSDSALVPIPDHVDYSVFGALPLELYLETKDKRYLNMGLAMADKQWGPPEGPRVVSESHKYYEKGFTWQTRLWVDDMYMITMLQAQAYRATGDRKYIDRNAKEMVYYLDQLQNSNGLFYHGTTAPFFWGRANGWMAAAMTELLRALPDDHPDRKRVLEGYQKMMSSLLGFQGEDGMWRQLLDDAGTWPETSSTAMITFAMITGIKKGWLDKEEFTVAVRRSWPALIKYLNDNGEIREVCEGTGPKNDRQYYLDRKRKTGDYHGQAPILWCAAALLRKE